MFEAIDEQGNRINSQLETMDTLVTKKLFCPYCRTRLRVRQGNKRLHFVHLTACTGESSEHAAWKKRLASYFEQLDFDVELEAIRGRRRFDLLLQPGAIGIEIQRSKMTGDEWIRRLMLDSDNGYEVRWIGFREKEGPFLKLDGWMKEAFAVHGYMDVIEKGRIVRYTNPLPFSRRVVLCQQVPLTCQQFLTPHVPPRKFPERLWSTLIKNYRMRPFFSSFPRSFLHLPMYRAHLCVSTLPSYCFLPLSSLTSLQVHPFELQIAAYVHLNGHYSTERLTLFLENCFHVCRIRSDKNRLKRLVQEWTVSLRYIHLCLPEALEDRPSDLAVRLAEDQKLAGALRLFVERETGINEVKE
ncbi:competence protein CoiA family protein [Exiguobacterium antarcticum]|uniref:Competence protein CoiA family protein n=1 Tax=Exiguobacterium antarcticum TaxID=132920 RepID=A0ABT6R148_9BACL|nr:competence protein CoiA family protein [Exiguobacterium antarcticum]AFS71001.1 Competence protein CoiA-like family [Exiguobacterium antarcticum B7]MDI3234565.1 competence protein CoiA family protein [Exiguobacterium antarcticum]